MGKLTDWLNKIRGGKATIEFVPQPENLPNIWDLSIVHSFIFHIRALNPNSEEVISYLEEEREQEDPNSSYLRRFWFIIKLIRHESGTHGRNEFEQFNRDRNNIGFRYNNNQIGMPKFGVPRGFGLGQIDNFDRLTNTEVNNLGLAEELADIQPDGTNAYHTIVLNTGRTIDRNRWVVASDDKVWNWKTNIDAIITIIEAKIDLLLSDIGTTTRDGNNIILEYGISSIRTFIQNWNEANTNDQTSFPIAQDEGEISYQAIRSDIAEFNPYNDLFPATPVSSDIRKSFFDAMLLKAYNGIGGGDQRAHYMHLKPIPQVDGKN